VSKHFTLEYWQDGGYYVGKLKEIPGIFSQGKTLKDLKENILDAYNIIMKDNDESIPDKVKNNIMQVELNKC